jgi:anti-anti-sigma factor
MKVKIDTKEKFHVITIKEPILAANMTEDFKEIILSFQNSAIKNIIINCKNISEMDEKAANTLVAIQQSFYDKNSSLVISNLQLPVESFLDKKELLELMNVTPTEGEAGDIVQMEEIERELGF